LNIYESDKALAEYLLFHYGSASEIAIDPLYPSQALGFAVRCAELVIRHAEPTKGRVLDLGCAVGSSSFTLSKYFDEVVGIDFSASFIQAAGTLKKLRSIDYQRQDEGVLTTPLVARLEPEARSGHVFFEQGDACHLRKDLGKFEALLMANLICRLPDPAACLERSKELVNSGGVLVITSPCSWMTEFTPREKWLGGFMRHGVPVRTLDGIKEILVPDFRLVETSEEPFLIREHARKYQLSSAQVSVWRRL